LINQKTDGVIELVDDLLNRTKEYLQPNPATRAKLMLSSKVVQSKTHAYPQPEGKLVPCFFVHDNSLIDPDSSGTLGEAMLKASQRLGDNSVYGMLHPHTHVTFASSNLKFVSSGLSERSRRSPEADGRGEICTGGHSEAEFPGTTHTPAE
jgi:hypothetical protein